MNLYKKAVSQSGITLVMIMATVVILLIVVGVVVNFVIDEGTLNKAEGVQNNVTEKFSATENLFNQLERENALINSNI